MEGGQTVQPALFSRTSKISFRFPMSLLDFVSYPSLVVLYHARGLPIILLLQLSHAGNKYQSFNFALFSTPGLM